MTKLKGVSAAEAGMASTGICLVILTFPKIYAFTIEKMMASVRFWLDLRHGRFRSIAPLICGRKPRSLPSRLILPDYQYDSAQG
jgi:hypothetical protein